MTDNQWEFENGTNQGKVKAKLCLNGCQLWKLMLKYGQTQIWVKNVI